MERLVSNRQSRSSAGSAADRVRHDFDRLVGIFDTHLSRIAQNDCDIRDRIHEAKTAAERGRELSDKLERMLRKAG